MKGSKSQGFNMTYEQYNAFCKALPSTTYVCQWGGAHVWKVGGKVFAIGGWNEQGLTGITFKVSELDYEILRERPGCRPAPYLASRGMKWIQHYNKPGLPDKDLKYYIQQSYRTVGRGLSKRTQKELGLSV
jgi:predicted DNA-binding protein (MmcQ/YjbR family)